MKKMSYKRAVRLLNILIVKLKVIGLISSEDEESRALDLAVCVLDEMGSCQSCARRLDNCEGDRTRCPIEEHYYLPRDGYCHLYEKSKRKKT